MSAHLVPTPPPSAPDPAEDALYYRGALHTLIDLGVEFARMLHHEAAATQAQAQPEASAQAPSQASSPAIDPHLPVAFDRIARTVRRTIMLARKVAEPMPTPAPAPADPAPRRAQTRRRIIRAVEDVIQRSAGSSQAEALHREFLDRLDAPDLDDDIAHRPAADIIVDICRDLGLSAPPGTHPWQRRTPADIAILCARAAAPPTSPPRSAHALSPPGSDPPDPG